MSLGRCLPDDTPDEFPDGPLTPMCVDCAAGRPYCTDPCDEAKKEIADCGKDVMLDPDTMTGGHDDWQTRERDTDYYDVLGDDMRMWLP